MARGTTRIVTSELLSFCQSKSSTQGKLLLIPCRQSGHFYRELKTESFGTNPINRPNSCNLRDSRSSSSMLVVCQVPRGKQHHWYFCHLTVNFGSLLFLSIIYLPCLFFSQNCQSVQTSSMNCAGYHKLVCCFSSFRRPEKKTKKLDE